MIQFLFFLISTPHRNTIKTNKIASSQIKTGNSQLPVQYPLFMLYFSISFSLFRDFRKYAFTHSFMTKKYPHPYLPQHGIDMVD